MEIDHLRERGTHCRATTGCIENRKLQRKIEATRTGLEPATSGSTVRGSNQLSYRANGWREKYIDTTDTRKAFLRLVFPADFAKSWSLTIATVSAAEFAGNSES